MWNVQVAYTEDQHHECDVRSSSSREGQHAPPGQQDEQCSRSILSDAKAFSSFQHGKHSVGSSWSERV